MKLSHFYALLALILLLSSCANIDEAKSTISKLEMENKALKEQIDVTRDLIAQMKTQITASKEIIEELEEISNDKKLKSLVITDKNGFNRIKMFVDEEGVPRIRIYDENLEPTVSLFSYPVDSRGKGASGFAVVGKDEEPLVWLGNIPNQSRHLAFKDEYKTTNSLVIGNNFISNSSFLAMYDRNAKARYVSGINYESNVTSSIIYSSNLSSSFEISAFNDGRILRRMQDSNKMLRQANVIDGNNNLYEMHYDYQGNLKQALYIPIDNSKYQNYAYKKPGTQLWDWLSNIMTAKSLLGK